MRLQLLNTCPEYNSYSTHDAVYDAACLADLALWHQALLRLPKSTCQRTLILDLNKLGMRSEMYEHVKRFVWRLATREHVKTKGRCDVVIDRSTTLPRPHVFDTPQMGPLVRLYTPITKRLKSHWDPEVRTWVDELVEVDAAD